MQTFLRGVFLVTVLSFFAACEYLPEELKPDWELQFGTPKVVNETAKMHLYNFDTFLCDGARQIVVTFNSDDRHATILHDGEQRLLTRSNPVMQYKDGKYELFIMADGSLTYEKEHSPLTKHCVPLVEDGKAVEIYTYTPTITPEQSMSADPIFQQKMSK